MIIMNNKRILFPIFALFVIFSDELFYSLVSLLGFSLEAGMKSNVAILIAGIAYLMILGDLFNGKFTSRNRVQFIVLFVILLLYGITSFIYPLSGLNTNYTAAILVYGSLCIPAAYVGMRLARGIYEEAIMKYLPYFLVFVSLTVGYAIFYQSSQGIMLGEQSEDVFNYQNASYYMSFCSAYSVFCMFFVPKNGVSLIGKVTNNFAMSIVLFISVVGCVLGGGRGAFVFLVFIMSYLVYRIILLASSRKNNLNYFIVLFSVAAVIIYISFRYNIFSSVGAQRVSENLTSDSIRVELWRMALQLFLNSPIIGHGLGSIWWEIGLYSHNMFLDFMAEIGILGTTVMLSAIITMLVRLVRGSKASSLDMFVLLIFLGHLIQNMFSCYWFSSFSLFLVFGYVYGRDKRSSTSSEIFPNNLSK